MQYFLDTSETIPDGLGFDHFSLPHLLWLAAFVVTAVVYSLHYRSLSAGKRQLWRKVMAWLLITDELFKQIPLFIGGNFIPEYLPLHLCSINIFLVVWHAWRPNKLLGNFLYTICIPAAIAALLFPSWNALPAMNFMYLHSFTVHILLAVYPIALVAGGDIAPRLNDIPKCIALLLAMAAFVTAVNILLDTNFFFLSSVGKGNPLYWFKSNWGDHRLGFPVIITAVLIAMYLPMELYHSRKEKIA